jgi:membrane protein implicated in regulation of membrane protease activity
MPPWLVWVIVAAVLSVAELLTLTLAAGLLAVAAGAAAVTAALGVSAAGQAAAFAVAGGVSMAVVLPAVRRHRRAAHPARSGVAALVGRNALVVEPVDAHHGRVRIGGEVWSARAFAPGQVIPAGAVVDVFEIDGATALVYAEERS